MTGFEPATTRPPDVDSTGLSYIPKCGCKCSKKFWNETRSLRKNLMIVCAFWLRLQVFMGLGNENTGIWGKKNWINHFFR